MSDIGFSNPYQDCPDVTLDMADAAFEAFDDALRKMGHRMTWASLVPFYYAIQAAIDCQRNASKSPQK